MTVANHRRWFVQVTPALQPPTPRQVGVLVVEEEALVEQPTGVEVLGRTGEDAVVAVGVAPSDPFVYPLADDLPWTLDEPPQIALVKPLEKVTLVTSLKKLPPIGTRRTVIFRRQQR